MVHKFFKGFSFFFIFFLVLLKDSSWAALKGSEFSFFRTRGPVEFRVGKSGEWKAARQEVVLNEKADIKTHNSGFSVLKFSHGGEVLLPENTFVNVRYQNAERTLLLITLLHGHIFIKSQGSYSIERKRALHKVYTRLGSIEWEMGSLLMKNPKNKFPEAFVINGNVLARTPEKLDGEFFWAGHGHSLS